MCHQIVIFVLKSLKNVAKYEDLKIEIARMWEMKTKTRPVIVRALGMIKKGTQKYINEIPGNLSLAEIQKIVFNSTANILRIFLEEPFHSKRNSYYYYYYHYYYYYYYYY